MLLFTERGAALSRATVKKVVENDMPEKRVPRHTVQLRRIITASASAMGRLLVRNHTFGKRTVILP